MTLRGVHNEQYVTGRELGRGGEGTVYDLQHHSGQVLKRYNEPLDEEKISKLKQMVAMRSPGIEAYAAWPVDLVLDDSGKVCGFVMKKLTAFVPLHMIFNPMDRKKLFPDKGYNFLVHVARNLATAFHKLHEAGLVVGDVNEGNILISASGLVAFIDCDSFQVRGSDRYYFCEVGVPRYTPPELLKERSFDHVVRTVNTDSFSLAVLLFQLLFLGRHPFAGKNKLAADFDEETAIRKREFAYSLENKKKKLFPPTDSFSIANLSDELVALFHRAFEQDERPSPADWIHALDAQLLDMVTCGVSRLHSYPAKLTECPWCAFQNRKGILYFLDDSYLHARAALGDIESFVNGFNIEKLVLKQWEGKPDLSGVVAPAIEKRFYHYRTLKWGSIATLVAFAIISFALHLNVLFIPSVLFTAFIIYQYSGWTTKLNAEMRRRTDTYKIIKDKLELTIKEYNQPSDLPNYSRGLELLHKYVHDFRRLPEEFERRRRLMEERLYQEQLDTFLSRFDIDTHDIPSFGTTRKAALADNGIRTAADIYKLHTAKVPGIGPKNLQILVSWQRQLASGFVYIPDTYTIAYRLQQVNAEVAKIKSNLETLIRKEYQSLNYLKLNITNRATVLERQIHDISLRARQAELDVEEFRKIAA
jgi:DNA-binding helix-hairpin-helix protein with protein kinase domain